MYEAYKRSAQTSNFGNFLNFCNVCILLAAMRDQKLSKIKSFYTYRFSSLITSILLLAMLNFINLKTCFYNSKILVWQNFDFYPLRGTLKAPLILPKNCTPHILVSVLHFNTSHLDYERKS